MGKKKVIQKQDYIKISKLVCGDKSTYISNNNKHKYANFFN